MSISRIVRKYPPFPKRSNMSFRKFRRSLAVSPHGDSTPPNSEIIWVQNVGTKVVCGIIFLYEKKIMLKI